ncbi:MAG: hydrolase [Candidatus Sericytochromatia bacterium]
MRILKDDTLAVVIDIQERLFPHIYEHDKLLENCIKLISGLQTLEIPLVITEQYTKGLGFTLEPIIKQLENSYKPIEKIDFSCYGSEDFAQILKKYNKRNIIIFGIETHVCVLQTTLDLLENGYNPIIIEDCVSSRKINDKNIAINRMRQEGAIISSLESILFELCRKAGSDNFKSISKLVK